jgi:hypothetical protein
MSRSHLTQAAVSVHHAGEDARMHASSTRLLVFKGMALSPNLS